MVLSILKPDRGTILKPADTRIGYVPQKFEADRTIPMTVARFLALGNDAHAGELRRPWLKPAWRTRRTSSLASFRAARRSACSSRGPCCASQTCSCSTSRASGVDYAGEAELYDLIGALRDRHGLGVLLVSHDLHVVMAKSDRVLCLNGHVCCSGRPEAVARSSEYARLFGPEAARSLALYHHHHDHRHDITGAALPIADGASGGQES